MTTKNKTLFSGLIIWLFSNIAFAQEATTVAPVKGTSSFATIDIVLSIVAVFLLLVIAYLKQALDTSINVFQDRERRRNASKTTTLVLLLMLGAQLLFGQEAPKAAAAPTTYIGDMSLVTISLFFVVILELIILMMMTQMTKKFISPWEETVYSEAGEEVAAPKKATWWERINNFRPIDQEGSLDTGHNYDGIRELDNITPPWFTTSFAITIVFAFIYMYRYHVAHSALSIPQEYALEMQQAEIQKAEFLSKQANKVDETNVTMLGASDIETGKKLYTTNCVACHKDDGGGSVGPNFTDKYWLHKGGIKDIFTSIKYGWPDKGMKSWKDDFSPVQIAQLASYVKSLEGTNAAGGKAPQGDLYEEAAAPAVTPAADATVKK